MQHVLSVLASLGGVPIENCKVPEARLQPTFDMALRRILRDPFNEMGIGMEMRLIPGPGGDMRARFYSLPREGAGLRPVILYFHDGGFIIGDLDKFDATPRSLAQRTGAVVISVHYRQAPEHRFPAAHDDAIAAWRWLLEHATAIGVDPARAAIVGEGSGGNLAINVALGARGDPSALPRHVGLVTPMAGMLFDLPSHLEDFTGLPVTSAQIRWGTRKMFRKADDVRDLRMNPAARPDLGGLPPVTIILAEADPLRSEGVALADALRRSAVWVDSKIYDGVSHGFFGLFQVVNKAMFAHAHLARNLSVSLQS